LTVFTEGNKHAAGYEGKKMTRHRVLLEIKCTLKVNTKTLK